MSYGSRGLFPTLLFCFQPYLCSTLHSLGFWKALFVCNSHFLGFLFFDQIFFHFCPSSIPLRIFHLVFHVLFLLCFFSLHATHLHLAFVLSLILGLVLVFLLSFSSRPLFPSLSVLFPFLPSHLAFSSSPPMMCYYISWAGKCITVPCCALICSPPAAPQQALLVWSYCFLLPQKVWHSMWLDWCETSRSCAVSQQFLEPAEAEQCLQAGLGCFSWAG